MSSGFFPLSLVTQDAERQPTEPQCGECGLWKTCKSPKMKPTGKGRKGILIVAEAPGKDEDDRGVQLVGNSGRELEKVLRRHGIDLRNDCTLTNALICRPPDNKIPEGKVAKHVAHCRPNLIKTIEEVQPELIIPLGGTAVESLIGWLWGESTDGILRWAGYRIPSQRLNAWICPAFHPAYLLHAKDPVLDLIFERHVAAAAEKAGEGRPWRAVPDYASEVAIHTNTAAAASVINHWMDKSVRRVAFDFETTTLKPDGKHAQIYTCSVCFDGKSTIAFPWHGPVVEAMKRLLANPKITKIASNAKFEDRWTRAKLGVEVRGWASGSDTMLTAHAVENADRTRKISSVKFQAFAHLGQPRWDRHVEPYLKSPKGSGNAPNRIKECDLQQLLVYNGLDSLLEYKVRKVQKRLMGG